MKPRRWCLSAPGTVQACVIRTLDDVGILCVAQQINGVFGRGDSLLTAAFLRRLRHAALAV